eukprot:349777_1
MAAFFKKDNPSINDIDVEQPLLENTDGQIEGNHNDPELSTQKTVVNLNNWNVRITIWGVIYMVLTTASIQIGTSQQIFWNEDWDSGFWSSKNDYYVNELYWTLFTVGASILWWAAAILLLNLYCVCCNCKCIPVVGGVFIIGGAVQVAVIIDGIYLDCTRASNWDTDTDKADTGYCKVGEIALSAWIVLFSFYLAIDAWFSIGDNIRTRIFVKSFILCIQSFLIFLIENYNLQQLIKMEKNDTNYNPDTDHSQKFDYYSQINCNFSLFFWCIVLMIIIAMGYGDKNNPTKKLNIWIRRIIGWFIIGSTGGVLGLGTYAFIFFGGSIYYVFGAMMVVYDLQYL